MTIRAGWQSRTVAQVAVVGACVLAPLGSGRANAAPAGVKPGGGEVVPPFAVRVLKAGDEVFIRGCFSAEHDVVTTVGKGSNRQVNFRSGRLVPRDAEGVARRADVPRLR